MLKTVDLSQVMVIDIETVPQYASYNEVPPHLQDLWEQKTHSQRNPEQTPDDFYDRAGIMAEFGKIVCISMGVFYMYEKTQYLRIKSISGNDERQILTSFSNLLQKQPATLMFCAHNGKEFDLPYLCRRFLINSLE